MLNRRQFLTASATGMAACALGGGAAAFQRNAQGARREVSVAGRRVKTIDVHCHFVIPGIMELLGQTTPANARLIIGPERVREMDRQGIDVEALSINPFWYAADRDLAGRLIRMQNEQLAAVCATYPDRLVGLATVALQHPDLAAQQLEFGVTKLGLRGASLGASVNGEELASPRFEPFWAQAERLDVPVFIHPQGAPALSSRLQGNGVLTNVIGNPPGYDDRAVAFDLRRHAGSLSRAENLRRSWRRVSAVVCRPLRSRMSDVPRAMQPDAAETADRISQAAVLRLTGVLGRGAPPSACGVGGQPAGVGNRPSVPMDGDCRRPRARRAGLSDADRVAILGGNAARLLKIAA